jgi:hypothetical protein
MIKVEFVGCGIFKDKNGKLYYYDDEGIFFDDYNNKYEVGERDKDTEVVLSLKNKD